MSTLTVLPYDDTKNFESKDLDDNFNLIQEAVNDLDDNNLGDASVDEGKIIFNTTSGHDHDDVASTATPAATLNGARGKVLVKTGLPPSEVTAGAYVTVTFDATEAFSQIPLVTVDTRYGGVGDTGGAFYIKDVTTTTFKAKRALGGNGLLRYTAVGIV